MAIFQPIKLSWRGKAFAIPAERVLGAIASIEEVATFPEIIRMVSGTPNMSKIARAYGAVLRYAGAVVDDEEVYEGMFQPGSTHAEVLIALSAGLAPARFATERRRRTDCAPATSMASATSASFEGKCA